MTSSARAPRRAQAPALNRTGTIVVPEPRMVGPASGAGLRGSAPDAGPPKASEAARTAMQIVRITVSFTVSVKGRHVTPGRLLDPERADEERPLAPLLLPWRFPRHRLAD